MIDKNFLLAALIICGGDLCVKKILDAIKALRSLFRYVKQIINIHHPEKF